jgi:tetratricopeptide (TPR) repeat protein
MSQGSEIGTKPSGTSRRRRLLIAGGVAGTVVAFVLAFRPLHRTPPTEPPLPDWTGVDPEVVDTIQAARQEVAEKPTSEPAWGRLGMVLNAHGFPLEANLCYAEAERLGATDPRWPYLRGVNLLPTDPDAGIACLERAVERCGDVPPAPRLRLAEALLDRGRLDEAERQLRQSLAREPNNLRGRLGLGRLAFLREDWRGAVEQLATCAGDEHARKLAHSLSAQSRRRLGEASEAQAEADKAEKLPEDTGWPDPFADEMAAWQRGLKARIQEASDLMNAGKPKQAIAVLEQAASQYPKAVQVWLGLGALWFQVGRVDAAEAAFRQAVQVDPNAAEGWFRLGCLQARNRPQEAADSFRRVIRLRPDHTLAHFNLGHRLQQLGDPAGACEEFRAALRCRPDYAPAREALRGLEKGGKAPPTSKP